MIFLNYGNCMNYTSNLELIYDKLNKLKNKKYKYFFAVPGLWLDQEPIRTEINPYHFFLTQIDKIKLLSADKVNHKEPAVYNLFVRLSTAYDHNGDKSLNLSEHQFRETGTFLKAIAMLPYIKSLGTNTIYLLPVTAIGEDEKKGNLGSPYAIRNPYMPDNNLSEPILGLDVETEFKAFAEAVHLLGMKLVCEFVFRTASIDSDLALEHPDWFYWLNEKVKNRQAGETSEAKYGPPIFLKKELEAIKLKIETDDFSNLIPPHEQHKKMFTEVPKKVARVDGRIRGLLADKKTEVRIPGAFADWPPDDTQPAWTDVTFLKLYEHGKFNYIAYNTIRMYDDELAKPELAVSDLWDYITGIIPHYINLYNLDGVMIDMGHALPTELRKRIVAKAIECKQEFFFWEENFNLNNKSVEDGYSAVLGYMPFDAHKPDKLHSMIERFSKKKIPVNFFATSETHNTPRSFARISNSEYLKSIYAFSLFLPAITFIHSGFEVAELNPVNTGLDFTKEELAEYPAEKLGLFSAVALDWDNDDNIIKFIQQINKMKLEIISDADNVFEVSIFPIETNNHNIAGFIRRDKLSQTEVVIVANFSENVISGCEIDLFQGVKSLNDMLSNQMINTENGKFNLKFNAYELKILRVNLE